MHKDTVTAYRSRTRATEALVDASVAAVKAEQAEKFAAAKAAAATRNAPVAFTDAEYLAARAVRTKLGWFAVAKVNAKSVMVKTGYSWDDRITRAKVLEVRA